MQYLLIVLGLAAGAGMPVQTSVNTRLKMSVGTPIRSSLISFSVAFIFLVCILPVFGQEISFPLLKIWNEPLWIWIGGICGFIFLTANIFFFAKLGGVQTVVFTVLGQILMGLVIDDLALFKSDRVPLTIVRLMGACMVIAGVIIVAVAKEIKPKSKEPKGKSEGDLKGASQIPNMGSSASLWVWRIVAVGAGMLSATQTAVNGYLGQIAGSPIKASAISCGIGIICLASLCIIQRAMGKSQPIFRKENWAGSPWWMWTGGFLGALYITSTVILSRQIGTGLTVIIMLIGSTSGGLVIDQFGLFQSPVKPINTLKIFGIIVMIAGTAAIKLL